MKFKERKNNEKQNDGSVNLNTSTAIEYQELTEDSARRYFSFWGFSILTAFVMQEIAQILILTALYLAAPSALNNPYITSAIGIIPLYCVGLPICLWLTRKLPRVSPQRARIPAGKLLGGLCVAFALMLTGNTASMLITNAIELAKGSSVSNPVSSLTQDNPVIATLIFTVIVAPILEELFFRKLLCDRLLPFGEGYAVFISSAIFALAHGNFFQIFYAFLIGCFFSFIYVKTGKIGYTVIYHVIINFTGTLVVMWITSAVDADAIAKSGITLDMLKENTLPVIAYIAYDALMIALSFIGTLIVFTNHKKISLQKGILSPPQNAKISCVFMNFGVACAIAYFALRLVLSLIV